MKPIEIRKDITNKRMVTLNGDIKMDMKNFKNNDKGHCHFLKSSSEIEDHPSRAPMTHSLL